MKNGKALGIRVLLMLGMLLVLGVASADTPASVRADGGDTSLVHGCVNQGNADLKITFPGGPKNDPNFPCPAEFDPVHMGTDTTFDGTDFALSNQACTVGLLVTGVDINGNVNCEVAVTTLFANNSVPPNATFASMWGGHCASVSASCLAVVPRDGTLSNLLVAPTQAPNAGVITKVSVNVNGVDTALSITHTDADGASIKTNTVDLVSVSQGDQMTVSFTETGGVQSPTYLVSFELK